jgi:hypothetical protein
MPKNKSGKEERCHFKTLTLVTLDGLFLQAVVQKE